MFLSSFFTQTLWIFFSAGYFTSLSVPQVFLPHYLIIKFCEIKKKKLDCVKIHNLPYASINSILLGGTGRVSPFLCLVFKAVEIVREKKVRQRSERGR